MWDVRPGGVERHVPSAAVPPLPDDADVDVLAPPGLVDEAGPGVSPWRHGYVWARLGRYDHAWAWWDEAETDGPVARTLGSRAAALRELGLHRPAEDLDRSGLGTDALPWEHAALLIGLVADAVGIGAGLEAVRRLERATDAVEGLSSDLVHDRQRIRLGWVEVEVALLVGQPPRSELPRVERTADGDRVEVPPAYRAGSVHHLAKGLLFRGVVDRDLGALQRAADIAPPSLAWAVHLARDDLGVPGARDDAARLWRQIVPPPDHADAVSSTPTARRLNWPPPR